MKCRKEGKDERQKDTERKIKKGQGEQAGGRCWKRPSKASRGFIDRLQIASGGPGDSH
jgi:hypothetical protein